MAPLLQIPHYATAEKSLDGFPSIVHAGKPVHPHLKLTTLILILVVHHPVDDVFLVIQHAIATFSGHSLLCTIGLIPLFLVQMRFLPYKIHNRRCLQYSVL